MTLEQRDESRVPLHGHGLNGNARLQWRSQGGADVVTLTPIAYYNRGDFRRDSVLTQDTGATPAPYDTAESDGEYASSLLRLNGQWNHRIASGGRLEWRAGIGQTRASSSSFRTEFTDGERLAHARRVDPVARHRRHEQPQADRIDPRGSQPRRPAPRSSRTAATTSARCCRTASRCSPSSATTSSASSLRLAAYVQDEWNLTPNWAVARGPALGGDLHQGSAEIGEPEARNRSDVWTPLLHAVWKPDPKGRDQVRISLTRSYRSPPLSSLIARPPINAPLSDSRTEHADPARPRRQPRPQARARDRHRHRASSATCRAAACSAPTSSAATSATTCAA